MVAMQIFTSDKSLSWKILDLPWCEVTEDWSGSTLKEPSTFNLVKDVESLWFISNFPISANIHPTAFPGQFSPELWKYDVAELFLTNPTTGEYLEFNLTSNGAWWASKFSSVRTPSAQQPNFSAQIRSHYDLTGVHRCVAGIQIPINFLKKEIDFGITTAANIAIIRDSPSQRYLSASKLPGPQPDFHQPAHFQTVTFTPLHSI